MATIINLTPHSITILLNDQQVTFPASGSVSRVASTRVQVDQVLTSGAAIPVNSVVFGEITGLPPAQMDTVYIVSAMVAQAAKRSDVLSVDDAVRDEQGRIVGARAFASYV